MKRKYILRAACLICALMTVVSVATVFNAATYRKGSSGQTVRQIQTKLKNWGYYKGSVDGIYGSQTVEAVKYFQRKNGLSVDGVCGSRTLAALGISSGSGSSASSGTNNDAYLLAKMISAEARGEPYIGQVAVGAVILNRVKHPSFPNTIAGCFTSRGPLPLCPTDSSPWSLRSSAKGPRETP